jgi:hypothetical protein
MRPVSKGQPANYRADINTRTIDFINIDNSNAMFKLTNTFQPLIKDVILLLDDLASGKTKELLDEKIKEKNAKKKELNKEEKALKKIKQTSAVNKRLKKIVDIKGEITKITVLKAPIEEKFKNLKKVKGSIEGKLSEIYKESSNELKDILGSYCSYCELPERSSALAVEHVVPKAPYPIKFVDWNNFLLGCPNCNSVKLSKPPRKDAKSWVAGMATADQLAQAVLDHYYWPHISQYSFRFYIYTLQYKQINSFTPLSMPFAANHQKFRNVNPRGRTVMAEVNISGTTWTRTEFVVLPIALAPSSTFVFDKSKVENTIDLIKLNRRINDDQEKDIRTFNRTDAWFKVLRQLDLLDKDITRAGTDAQKKDNFNSSWGRLLDYAVSEGFYSIWITILKEIQYPNYLDNLNRHRNLGEKFVYDTGNTQTDLYRKFPGTNATSLP